MTCVGSHLCHSTINLLVKNKRNKYKYNALENGDDSDVFTAARESTYNFHYYII